MPGTVGATRGMNVETDIGKTEIGQPPATGVWLEENAFQLSTNVNKRSVLAVEKEE